MFTWILPGKGSFVPTFYLVTGDRVGGSGCVVGNPEVGNESIFKFRVARHSARVKVHTYIQRKRVRNHFTLMLIVVVLETTPEVAITVMVLAPFGVDIDFGDELHPATPTPMINTTRTGARTGRLGNSTVFGRPARRITRSHRITAEKSQISCGPQGFVRLGNGSMFAVVEMVSVVLPDVLPTDVFAGLREQVAPVSDEGAEQLYCTSAGKAVAAGVVVRFRVTLLGVPAVICTVPALAGCRV